MIVPFLLGFCLPKWFTLIFFSWFIQNIFLLHNSFKTTFTSATLLQFAQWYDKTRVTSYELNDEKHQLEA